jgi:glycosyltransferase involved in cell wall biosynthesis
MPVTNEAIMRDAKFVVTETDFARRWVQERYPRDAGKIFRVYNGLDDHFPARTSRAGPPLILSVGRLVEKKGFSDLIEACRALRERGIAFTCEIVGDGPLDAVLQEQIRACGLQEAVCLLGPRSQTEVRQLLAESHIFVLACVPEQGGGSDNLPTVVMEAMMCGLPVISTTLAGVPEMITSGENGLLVGPRNPRALAAAIEQLLVSSEQASQLARHAGETAREKFHLSTTTRSLKHLLVQEARVVPSEAACEHDPELINVRRRRWFF